MATENLLILIHGMTPFRNPGDHIAEYRDLRNQLARRKAQLGTLFDDPHTVAVEWGHEPRPADAGPPPVAALRPDQRLTRAENRLVDRVAFANVRKNAGPGDHFLGPFSEILSRLLLRQVTTPIKERVFLLGLTDVLYYCSPEGEQAVRRTVYQQFLEGLKPYRTAESVRLHVIGQSLGATIAFDFLFGLFAPDSEFPGGEPGFVRENPDLTDAVDEYMEWRGRAHDTLLLGSKVTTGAQIPLMLMRKQKLVDRLARDPFEPLDPMVIGVPRDGAPRWKIFYDVDDVLGFPARALFASRRTIQEYQVDTNLRPDLAHIKYWEEDRVLDETAEMIAANLG
jgi:hypothetical protein